MKFFRVFIAALCVGLVSCDVHESDADCEVEMRLSFRFTRGGDNHFNANEVPSLSIFVFDKNETFVGRYDELNNTLFDEYYVMTLPLMPGDYKFVVWGGLNDTNYYLSTNGRGANSTLAPVVGRTKLNDFALRIKRNTRNELTEKKNYVEVVPGALFFGTSKLETIAPNTSRELVIDLQKHTRRINLTVLGMPPAKTRALYDHMNITLDAPNGSYNFAGGMTNDRDPLTWIQHDVADDGDLTQTSTIYTLRTMFEDNHTLRVHNRSTSLDFYSADLLRDYIRKHPDYRRQEDVDAEDEYDITVDLRAPLAIMISVNGWDFQHTGGTIIQ